MADPNFESEIEAAVDAAVDKSGIPGFLKGMAKGLIHMVLPALFVELEALLKKWGGPQTNDSPGPVGGR